MLQTNGERLKAMLQGMGQIGATPAGGVTRLGLSDEDRREGGLFATPAAADAPAGAVLQQARAEG